MNSLSPEKSTISSKILSVSLRRNPRIDAFMYTFSRPVRSGWNPAPNSSSAEMRPSVVMRPLVGRWMPAMRRSRLDLPDPLWPTSPYMEPCGISSETSLTAQNSS